MKKILILANDFPPFNSIGAQRPASWYKYFHENGLFPVVVTRHWDEGIQSPIDYIKPSFKKEIEISENPEGTIIRVPYSPNLRDRLIIKFGLEKYQFLRKFLTIILSVFKFINSTSDNTINIQHAARDYLKNNEVKCIIATGEPFILFKYASVLSSKFQIPWISDFRDAWTNNPSISESPFFNQKLNSLILKRIEKKIVTSSSLITTPSPSYIPLIREIHQNKSIELIYNGYDIQNCKEIESLNANEKKMMISYAGIIYPHQDLEQFLKGFELFINSTQANNIIINFFGLAFYPEMVNRLLSFNKDINKFFNITQRIPYQDVIKELRQSHLLLLLSKEGMDWLNAKVFDYLAVNRKILLVSDDKGILSNILDKTNAGLKFDNPENLAKSLEILYSEFQSTGEIKHQSENYQFYSRKEQARILCEKIKKLINSDE